MTYDSYCEVNSQSYISLKIYESFSHRKCFLFLYFEGAVFMFLWMSSLHLYRMFLNTWRFGFFLVLNRGTRLPVQSDLNRRWSAVSNALWGSYVTQHGGKATGVIYSSFSPLSFTLPLSTYLFCMFLPMFVSTKRRISVCLQEFRSQCFLFVPFVDEACVSWLNISKHEHSGTFIVFHICSHSRSHVSWSTYFWHSGTYRNSHPGGWLCHITPRSAVTHCHRGSGVSHDCDTHGHVVCCYCFNAGKICCVMHHHLLDYADGLMWSFSALQSCRFSDTLSSIFIVEGVF